MADWGVRGSDAPHLIKKGFRGMLKFDEIIIRLMRNGGSNPDLNTALWPVNRRFAPI